MVALNGAPACEINHILTHHQGLYSLKAKTCYCQIGWSLEVGRDIGDGDLPIWTLTGVSVPSADVRKISEWLQVSKPESRGFETSRDLAARCPSAYLSEGQNQWQRNTLITTHNRSVLITACTACWTYKWISSNCVLVGNCQFPNVPRNSQGCARTRPRHPT